MFPNNLEDALYQLQLMIAWSLTIATPILGALGIMFGWRFYKKFSKKEETRAKQILVKVGSAAAKQSARLEYLDKLIAAKESQLGDIDDNYVEDTSDDILDPDFIPAEDVVDDETHEDNNPDESTEIDPAETYNAMTKKELEQLAIARGIKGSTRMKKNILIKELIKHPE